MKWTVTYTVKPITVEADSYEEAIETAAAVDTEIEFVDCEEEEDKDEFSEAELL